MADNIIFEDNKYKIIYDEAAGFYHLSPLPTNEELKKYYSQEFYAAGGGRQINDSSKKVQAEEADFISLQYDDILEIIEKKALGRKIIDIGCGYGNFLKFCQQRGFEVFGLDPSAEAVAGARDLGVAAVVSEIEDASAKINKKYDAAVLLNVLEHLRQPREALADIRNNILADNGLLIIRVPNEFNKLQVIANQEYDLKYWWVNAPQHINYFTTLQLENLINNSGFEVILKEASFPLEMFILFGDQYVGNQILGKTIHQKRVRFEKALKKNDNNFKRKMYQNLAEIGLGREITIYARRK